MKSIPKVSQVSTEPQKKALYKFDSDTATILKELRNSSFEVTYDRLTMLAAKLLKVPVALISIVNEEDQFFKSFNGLGQPWVEHRVSPRSSKFCRKVVNTGQILLISNAPSDPNLTKDIVTVEMGVVAYLGIPMTLKNGITLGSYCAIDTKPRRWSEEEIAIMVELNQSLMREIELRLALRQAEYAKDRAEKANNRVVLMLDRMLDNKS